MQAGDDIGDNGPATDAKLFMPSDIALDPRTGDVYIADMHHYRVRKVDAKTRVITTVAGNGKWQNAGDDGPAVRASFTGPAGVAVMPDANASGQLLFGDHGVAPDAGHQEVAGNFGSPPPLPSVFH